MSNMSVFILGGACEPLVDGDLVSIYDGGGKRETAVSGWNDRGHEIKTDIMPAHHSILSCKKEALQLGVESFGEKGGQEGGSAGAGRFGPQSARMFVKKDANHGLQERRGELRHGVPLRSSDELTGRWKGYP